MQEKKSRGGARPNAGRPKSEKKYVQSSVRIKENDYRIIRQHAEIAQCSVASLLEASITFGEIRAYAHMLSQPQAKKSRKK